MHPIDKIITPELHSNTQIYHAIQAYLKRVPVKTVIEIGASSGGGTTEALVNGLLAGPTKGEGVRMASIEVSKTRFQNLKQTYQHIPFFTPYNTSSLPLSRFPTDEQLIKFCIEEYKMPESDCKGQLDMLHLDIEYVTNNGFDTNGIQQIKDDMGVTTFDLACIDGSEYLGYEEYKELPGCDAYILDDYNVHKNWFSHKVLLEHPEYVLFFEEKPIHGFKNGSSMFCKKSIINKYFASA
jgi:hypothetical protein